MAVDSGGKQGEHFLALCLAVKRDMMRNQLSGVLY